MSPLFCLPTVRKCEICVQLIVLLNLCGFGEDDVACELIQADKCSFGKPYFTELNSLWGKKSHDGKINPLGYIILMILLWGYIEQMVL